MPKPTSGSFAPSTQEALRAKAPETGEVTWLALVAEKVRTLDYGVVQIVVHDGRVVQVERTERHRFEIRAGS